MLQLSLLMKDTSIRQADENIVIKKKLLKECSAPLTKLGEQYSILIHPYSWLIPYRAPSHFMFTTESQPS